MKDDAGWQIEISPFHRFGPFSWSLSARRGIMGLSSGWFAWTEAGAERKAQRILRRLNAQDERCRAKTRVVG